MSIQPTSKRIRYAERLAQVGIGIISDPELMSDIIWPIEEAIASLDVVNACDDRLSASLCPDDPMERHPCKQSHQLVAKRISNFWAAVMTLRNVESCAKLQSSLRDEQAPQLRLSIEVFSWRQKLIFPFKDSNYSVKLRCRVPHHQCIVSKSE